MVDNLNARVSQLVAAQACSKEDAERRQEQMEELKRQHRQELSGLECAQTQLRHALQAVKQQESGSQEDARASEQSSAARTTPVGTFLLAAVALLAILDQAMWPLRLHEDTC